MKTKIHFEFEEGLINQMQDFALNTGTSISLVLQQAGREYLSRFNKPKKRITCVSSRCAVYSSGRGKRRRRKFKKNLA